MIRRGANDLKLGHAYPALHNAACDPFPHRVNAHLSQAYISFQTAAEMPQGWCFGSVRVAGKHIIFTTQLQWVVVQSPDVEQPLIDISSVDTFVCRLSEVTHFGQLYSHTQDSRSQLHVYAKTL